MGYLNTTKKKSSCDVRRWHHSADFDVLGAEPRPLGSMLCCVGWIKTHLEPTNNDGLYGKSLRLCFYLGMVPSVVFGVCSLFLGFEGSGPYLSCLTKNPHLERLPRFLKPDKFHSFPRQPSCEKFPEILHPEIPEVSQDFSPGGWVCEFLKGFVSASHRMI